MDDLNTPGALAELHRLYKEGDTHALAAGAQLLGLLEDGMGDWAAGHAFGHDPDMDERIASLVAGLLAERSEARKQRDFARADAIRDGFAAAGIAIRDTPQGALFELTPHFDPAKLKALQ